MSNETKPEEWNATKVYDAVYKEIALLDDIYSKQTALEQKFEHLDKVTDALIWGFGASLRLIKELESKQNDNRPLP